MHKTHVRATYRKNPDGVGTHKVKAHKRDVKGARQHGTASVGFQPVTPVRASCGVLVGSAAYWTFSGIMSTIAALGFALTAACGAIMGYNAVQRRRTTRSRKRKRPVAVLRAKVAVANAKQKTRTNYRQAKAFLTKRQERQARWRKRVRKMPLGRRLNPAYRVRRWWRFRMDEYKKGVRAKVDSWLEKAYKKTHRIETTEVKRGPSTRSRGAAT